MTTKTFAEVGVGQRAEFETVIDVAMIDAFAALSGDVNPLHTDDAYARRTTFGRRVPHGMIGGALFSRFVGLHLPGRYSLYLSQSLLFRRPLPLDSAIVVSGEIVQKIESARAVKMTTRITDKESGVTLVDGEAVVQLLQ
jgi:3-hydroxybutyryl-CoA dehydratase